MDDHEHVVVVVDDLGALLTARSLRWRGVKSYVVSRRPCSPPGWSFHVHPELDVVVEPDDAQEIQERSG
jgi:predicted ATP-grasp superfamily ATP-dependent carboligase